MKKLPFCEAPTHRLFSGPIRDGAFGNWSRTPYDVWQYEGHGLAFLDPMPVVDYRQDAYRCAVNAGADIATYLRLHDALQPDYLKVVSPWLQRGQRIADCGCGGGSFLDLVRGQASETIGIDPFTGYHPSLRERGHRVFAGIPEAQAAGVDGTVDLAVSFHVIEHTPDPVEFLRGIGRLLRPGGIAVLLTPNLDDILMRVHFDAFAPFFFRTAHNLYFTADALAWTAAQAGLQLRARIHHHTFGLANTMLWLRDRRPPGGAPLPGISPAADGYWKSYLESSGQSDTVGIVVSS